VILYDEPQEAHWFRQLHPCLAGAEEAPITGALKRWPKAAQVLSYDRPDIVLLDNGEPILVVEQTVEVPSGHNVGQRFARIVAAAESKVPCIYLFPYVARKHGGDTAGPRYVNLRLFQAMDALSRTTGTALTPINWPVDTSHEVVKGTKKDIQIRAYLDEFFKMYADHGLQGVNVALRKSAPHAFLIKERQDFERQISRASVYTQPPASVEILPLAAFSARHPMAGPLAKGTSEVVLYKVGMTYIRSDPYAGTALLYRSLYLEPPAKRMLVLEFPHITISQWRKAAASGGRKDVRLFSIAADGIIFRDGYLARSAL
jgi:hypothetical protein